MLCCYAKTHIRAADSGSQGRHQDCDRNTLKDGLYKNIVLTRFVHEYNFYTLSTEIIEFQF